MLLNNRVFFAAMFGILRKLFGPKTDFAALIEEGAVIIDVRSAQEYKSGHVKGSRHIPLDKIAAKANTIKRWNKPVITCCASGMRSGSAASILKGKGVEAYNGGSWYSVDRYVD